MSFWTTLRWAGALFFVLIVLVSWLASDPNGADSGSSDQTLRRAPLIVR